MNDTPPVRPSQTLDDEQQLRTFGYQQQFHRVLGLFADFSLGYSYMSPLAGFYALFAYALTLAGPPFFWTMVATAVGQLLVCLVLAEAASQYPIAGGVYQWARRLGGAQWGFLTAWIYMLALLGTTAGLAYGTAPLIATLLGTSFGTATSALVAVLLVGLAALLNFLGTKTVARTAEVGVWSGVIGTLVCSVYLLMAHRVQPLSALNQSFGAGQGSYSGALFAASLIGIWIYFGWEACGDLAEEVKHASREVPRAMILTMVVGGLSALALAVGMTLAIPDIGLIVSGAVTDPVGLVLEGAFGVAGSKLVLLIVILSFFSATTTLIASTSRLLFSLGRDRVLPGHAALSRMSAGGLPLTAIAVSSLAPALIIAVALLSSDVLTKIISFATTGIYTSFLMVVLAALTARARGWRPSGVFTLGRLGWLVTVVAAVFTVATIINLTWPRTPDAPWYDNYLVLISMALVVVSGLLQLGRLRPASTAAAGVTTASAE